MTRSAEKEENAGASREPLRISISSRDMQMCDVLDGSCSADMHPVGGLPVGSFREFDRESSGSCCSSGGDLMPCTPKTPKVRMILNAASLCSQLGMVM